MILASEEYVTAGEVVDRWGDVGAARLRDWVRERRVRPLTVGQLAAASGLAVPDGADPAAPARMPGSHGPQNLYPWRQLVEADAQVRASGRGAQRGARVDTPGPPGGA